MSLVLVWVLKVVVLSGEFEILMGVGDFSGQVTIME